tara:strand:- start:757 stop:891 length:135 start_codon:yes stop_codon:yes gene_type:complete
VLEEAGDEHLIGFREDVQFARGGCKADGDGAENKLHQFISDQCE